MKNFPDQDAFRELEKRLQNYSELPDDAVWEKIDSALRPSRRWILLPWLDGVTALMLVTAGLLSFNISGNQFLQARLDSTAEKSEQLEKPEAIDNLLLNSKVEQKKSVDKKAGQPVTMTLGDDEAAVNRNTIGKIQRPDIHHSSDATKETLMMDTSALSDSTSQKNLANTEHKTDTVLTETAANKKTDSVKQTEDVKETKQRRKRKHTFYAMITPSLSFQHAVPISRDGVVVTGFKNTSILSGDRFGFSINAGVQGFISKRFEYYGGLSFYHQNQTIKYTYQSTSEIVLEESGGNGYNVSPKSAVGIVNYKMVNVGVDAGFLYHLYGKMLTHKVGAGLTYQQGIAINRSEEYTNARSTYLSYQLFYRNELRLNARLRFFVQPTFAQSIVVNEKLNAPFNVKPYRAGLGFGILYGF